MSYDPERFPPSRGAADGMPTDPEAADAAFQARIRYRNLTRGSGDDGSLFLRQLREIGWPAAQHQEESDGLGGNQAYSPEVAQETHGKLNSLAQELMDARASHSTVLALRASGSGTVTEYPRWWIPPTEGIGQGEHTEMMIRAGYIERFAFKYHNGGLGMASISGTSPKGEKWHARFLFPKLPGVQGEEVKRMVVLDTWSTPAREYLPAQSGSGLPANAYDVNHAVYGRDELVSPEAQERLEAVLELFDEAMATSLSE